MGFGIMIIVVIGIIVIISLVIAYYSFWKKDKDTVLVNKLRKYYLKFLTAKNESRRDYWKNKTLKYINKKSESLDTIQLFYVVVNYMTKLMTLDITRDEFEDIFKEDFPEFYNNVEVRKQDFEGITNNIPVGNHIDPVDFTYAIFDYIDEESFSKAKHFDINSLRKEFRNNKKMFAFFEEVINIKFK